MPGTCLLKIKNRFRFRCDTFRTSSERCERGRTWVLPVRPVLYDARNLPAPIISVIIGLPLPVFATACILLPAALPLCRSARSARSSQPACHLPATCPPPARHLPAAPASLPACRSSRSARCSSLPAACSARSSQPAAPAAPACPLLCPFCLLCRSSQPACHLPAAPACPPLCPLLPVCKKSETFQSLAFLLSGLGLRQAPPRLSARQSRKPSRTSCSRILAQSATGCFSPSTNRSGHPRLQSSM